MPARRRGSGETQRRAPPNSPRRLACSSYASDALRVPGSRWHADEARATLTSESARRAKSARPSSTGSPVGESDGAASARATASVSQESKVPSSSSKGEGLWRFGGTATRSPYRARRYSGARLPPKRLGRSASARSSALSRRQSVLRIRLGDERPPVRALRTARDAPGVDRPM